MQTQRTGWLKRVVAAWRHWRAAQKDAAMLTSCGSDVGRIARDVGLTPDELHRLVAAGPGVDHLLWKRLNALGIDPAVIKADMKIERELVRCCSACASKSECAADLGQNPHSPAWRQYCPNTDVLAGLAPSNAP